MKATEGKQKERSRRMKVIKTANIKIKCMRKKMEGNAKKVCIRKKTKNDGKTNKRAKIKKKTKQEMVRGLQYVNDLFSAAISSRPSSGT
jgi:phosphosulfolactate synthase (CoM biosynthesis protein A)